MANTVIQLKHSTLTGNVPTSLANGEISINNRDGKFFYSTPAGVIVTHYPYSGPAGLNQEIQFNDSGVLGANSGLTFDKSIGALTVSGNVNSYSLITQTVSANSVVVLGRDLNAYANAAFATANSKTFTFEQNTAPATANSADFWVNSDTGVMYQNFGNTTHPTWAEVGPTGTLSNTEPGIVSGTVVYANAATAFIAGDAAISGVALQVPREGAIRNLYNGLNNMYFDVSIGGTTHGQFQFRSSSAFTNILTMSPTVFSINTDAVVTARTPNLGKLPWNSALDTELTVDDYRFRVNNTGGNIYAQVISNTGGTKNSAWTAVAAISGQAVGQGGSTGTLVPNNAWTSLYTFASMNSAGDTVTVTFQDKSQGRIYRITFMRSDNGSTTGYNIIGERLL